VRAIGFPLYVNGQRIAEPVTISHVPGPGDAQGVLGGGGVDPSMGGLGAYALYRATRGMRGFGADAAPTAPPPPLNPEAQPAQPSSFAMPAMSPAVRFLAITADLLSTAGLAYHGYRRNNSIGWAIGWAILGGAFPIIGWPVAIAQGFGKPRSMTPNRSRRRRARRVTRRRRRR
jgi:hypothetical protein